MNLDEKSCPYCGEAIKMIAIKCKHCQTDLSTKSVKKTKSKVEVATEKKFNFDFLGPTEKNFFKFIGFLCIIFGFLASLSGIGIIIGIPLIIIGAIFFFFPKVSLVLLVLLFIAYKFGGSWG